MKRLEAFWQGGLYDRVPIRVRYPVPGMSDEQWPKAGGDPLVLGDYWDQVCRARKDFPDDEIPALPLDMGPGFMGGVMGSPVRCEHGTTWAEHSLTDWTGLSGVGKVRFNEGNPWIAKLLAGSKAFAEKSRGKCAVGIAMLTGAGDIMTGLRGPEGLCLDFFEHPEELKQLAEICTKAWIETARLQFDTVPSFQGGYVDNYNIWTPGRSSYFANDISNLISAEQYREHFFVFDAKVAESLETPWLHVHSGGARLVPEFRKIPKLRGIQIVNDRPAGPEARDLIPIFKMIQENHLLLLRKYSRVELEEILPELSREGLYVDTQADSEEEAFRLLEWWEKTERSLFSSNRI